MLFEELSNSDQLANITGTLDGLYNSMYSLLSSVPAGFDSNSFIIILGSIIIVKVCETVSMLSLTLISANIVPMSSNVVCHWPF